MSHAWSDFTWSGPSGPRPLHSRSLLQNRERPHCSALAELLSATGQSLSLIATRNETFSRQVRPAGDEAPAASAAGRRSLSLSSECESCADVRRDRRLSRSAEESRRSSKEDPCSKATRSQLVAAGASLLLVVHGSRPHLASCASGSSYGSRASTRSCQRCHEILLWGDVFSACTEAPHRSVQSLRTGKKLLLRMPTSTFSGVIACLVSMCTAGRGLLKCSLQASGSVDDCIHVQIT